MFTGAGTVLNVVAVLVGGGAGLLLRQRFPVRTRDVVTDGLGLVTLLVAALSAAAVLDAALAASVGSAAPVLVVLGSVLLGGVVGSLLRIEDRLTGLGGALQRRTGGRVRSRAGRSRVPGHPAPGPVPDPQDAPDGAERQRFVQGFLTCSLLFCVGPLTVLGSLTDGLGGGIEMLTLKSVLDGFAAVAFAASLGVGVLASALTVAVVQGSLTVVGALLGGVLPSAHVSALTATGGVLLVGVALRLLRIRDVPVGDLLPALLVAPLLVELLVRLD